MPEGTSAEKVELIERQGGACRFVDRPEDVDAVARQIAEECGGHFMDQFTYAERATDWRGNNNIAESIFRQLDHEHHSVPEWIVVGAGTGGTSATIGRYLRYRRHATRLALVDPVGSAFFEAWVDDDPSVRAHGRSLIEGIGRPRVEASFVPSVVDRMIQVHDAESIAAMRVLRERTGLDVGGSTGTNLWGAMVLIEEMRRRGVAGSVVSLICDGGERYRDTYCDDTWVAAHDLDLGPTRPRGSGASSTAPEPARSGVGRTGRHVELEAAPVDVAPEPLLTGFEGPDDRVAGLVEVARRMLVRRVVAAAHVTALLAHPQVHPSAVDLQALVAAVVGRLDRSMVSRWVQLAIGDPPGVACGARRCAPSM